MNKNDLQNHNKKNYVLTIIGVIVAIIAVVIAILAWQFPNNPTPPLNTKNSMIENSNQNIPTPTPIKYGKVLSPNYPYPIGYGRLYLGMKVSEAQNIFADKKTDADSTHLVVDLEDGIFDKVIFCYLDTEFDPEIYSITFYFRDENGRKQLREQASDLFFSSKIKKKSLNNTFIWVETDESYGEKVDIFQDRYSITWNQN